MKREKGIGKSCLSGKKGGIIFIIGSLASIVVFFAVARIVDIIVKKTERDPPRSILPFAETQLPPAPRNSSTGDAPYDGVSPKLNFYTALRQNNNEAANTDLLNNKKNEPKSLLTKTPGDAPAPKQTTTPAEKNAAVQPTASQPTFVLQMGAYQRAAKAQSVVEILRRAGYHPYTDTIRVQGKGSLVRVRIGPFQDLAAAQKKAAEIEKKTKIPVGISKQ